MTATPLLTVALVEEADIVGARQRARQVAQLLGFERQDQTRIATAVSEIARNATSYGGGGRMILTLETDYPPSLVITVRDKGPGIAAIDDILAGVYVSNEGMGVGMIGTRRLMDDFAVESTPRDGTTVLMCKRLPVHSPVTPAKIREISKALAASSAVDPTAEMRTQNQDLVESLAALKAKQDEAEQLNTELQETNRGVVALYAELDEKAHELADLNLELESRVAVAVAEVNLANDALRQSQKMEAVGQLTGGIAHDFNNLLQIITGNLEILSRRLPLNDARLARPVESAMAGAQRAATLTQRLLAFSRRQPLDPKPIDANTMINGMFDLMHRTLGETVTVELILAGDLWPVEADANQLENAVLNLAVNARDAMPAGGPIVITSTNCVLGEAEADDDTIPGQYVALAVCDVGSGMSEDTLSRVLEPFFTTKEVGKGTGLGLSMVYGFVKQSGGHLRIESSIGRGTTVTLYLPRFAGKIAKQVITGEDRVIKARSGETILLVEDDEQVRRYSEETLLELGYAVVSVADGPAAVELLDGDARVDLLLTDVVLAGGLNGREIAEHCALVRPGTPVLYATGYAREAIIHQARLDPDTHVILKPFTFAGLSTRIAGLLGRAYE